MCLNHIRPNSSFPLSSNPGPPHTLSPHTFVCGHHGNHGRSPPAAPCAPPPLEFNQRFLHACEFGDLHQSMNSLPAGTTLENNNSSFPSSHPLSITPPKTLSHTCWSVAWLDRVPITTAVVSSGAQWAYPEHSTSLPSFPLPGPCILSSPSSVMFPRPGESWYRSLM